MNNQDGRERRVVVFFGMVASGKSTLGRRWASRHGYPYGNSDVLRKQLAGEAARKGEALYSSAHSRRTYQALLDFAAGALGQGDTVVLDGSYQRREERDRLRQRLQGLAKVVFVLCSCREETVRSRLAARAREATSVSDGDWRVYCLQKQEFEPPRELPGDALLRLETEREVDDLLATLDLLLPGKEGGGREEEGKGYAG